MQGHVGPASSVLVAQDRSTGTCGRPGSCGVESNTHGVQAAASRGTSPCLVKFSISCENLTGKGQAKC